MKKIIKKIDDWLVVKYPRKIDDYCYFDYYSIITFGIVYQPHYNPKPPQFLLSCWDYTLNFYVAIRKKIISENGKFMGYYYHKIISFPVKKIDDFTFKEKIVNFFKMLYYNFLKKYYRYKIEKWKEKNGHAIGQCEYYKKELRLEKKIKKTLN